MRSSSTPFEVHFEEDTYELEEHQRVSRADPLHDLAIPDVESQVASIGRRPSRLNRLLGIVYASPVQKHDQRRSETAWLDGLRGCAALLVVLFHWQGHAGFNGAAVFGAQPVWEDATETYTEWWRLPMVRWIYASGDAAVSIFFIISGFVLTRKSLALLRSGNRERFITSLSSTVFRRVIRLWIPSTIASLTGLLIIRAGYREQYFYPKPEDYTLIEEIGNWLSESLRVLSPYSFFQGEYVIYRFEYTLWTIIVEYSGSGLCFLTLVMLAQVSNRWYRRTFLILFGIHGPYFYKVSWWIAMFYAGIFFADLSLDKEADIPNRMSRSARSKVVNMGMLIVSLYLIQFPKASSIQTPFTTPGYTMFLNLVPETVFVRFWTSLGAMMLFITIHRTSWLKRLMESSLCQFLGRISFSLYLIHFQYNDVVALPYLNPLLDQLADELGILGEYLRFFLFWGIMLTSVTFLAAWHERWVDRPAIQCSRWIEKAITS